MARETHTFSSPEDLATYLVAATRKASEEIAEIVASVIEDGVILLDNGKIIGFQAWEITYEDETFEVVHEFGYLTADGEVV